MKDEFGRSRMVPRVQARQFVGIEVNLEEDYKEYQSQDTKGYHMFPPTMELATSGHHLRRALYRQNEEDNDGKVDADRVTFLTEQEKRRREREAEEEWRDAIQRPETTEHYDASNCRMVLLCLLCFIVCAGYIH